MKNFMIKLTETSDGRIIEIPDVILLSIVITFIVLIVSLSNSNK
jgi:hypothetical protein